MEINKIAWSDPVNRTVLVLAETTMQADALSTGVFVMEPGPGINFINTLPSCAALVITPQGRILKSRNWKSAAAA